MSFEQTVLLSAFAGVTIFLGLPVGRLRNLSPQTQAVLTAAAAGVVLFLLWDVLSQAIEPVRRALEEYHAGKADKSTFIFDALALGLSVSMGLLSITELTVRMRVRTSSIGPLRPSEIALGTAAGLGLHNFSEGLAIGASAATGETALALVLVIGFALHNATEGFGIAAPLTAGDRPTWTFLIALGVIGGGPTFIGGVVGYSFVAPVLSIAFLGLAAGALIFVFNEMVGVARRLSLPMAASSALLVGLLAGIGTDLVLTAAGA